MDFDLNALIVIIIFIALFMYGYTHIEHLTNEITYVKSTLDNREYLVRNMPDKQEAADLLATIRMKLDKICETMKEKYPDDDSVNRMVEKFNPENITEAGKNNKYTSYSVNKGEKIVFCIRQKTDKEELVDENTITFVAIHELAHIMTKSVGHTEEFWSNFKRLLKVAVSIGVYQRANYTNDPQDYCGIKVTDSPLDNAN
jgi:predicted metal-dependent hydrolase